MRISFGWRLVAWLVLLMYTCAVFFSVGLVLQTLPLVIVGLPTLSFLLYASWLILTGKGSRLSRGHIYMAVAAAALIVEFLLLMKGDRRFRLAFALLLLTGVYWLGIVVLGKEYWRAQRQRGIITREGERFERPWLIINPKSGNGRAERAHVDSHAKRIGIHVHILRDGEDVAAAAERALEKGADVLGISGGDGSIGAVARVALAHDKPIVVLPGGTRCHFARDLGLDPRRIVDSLTGFSGVERRVDTGSINGRIFLNNASFGLYADIVDHEDYREHKLEVIRRVVGEMAAGVKQPYDLRFCCGPLQFDQAVQVLVAVNSYQTMRLLELGHRDRLDGGVLQVTAITRLDDSMIRKLLRPMSLGRSSGRPRPQGIYQWLEDKEFVIHSSQGSIIAGVDGEREVYATPVHIEILPKALRIFVPPEGERPRSHQVFSREIVGRVWRAAVHGDPEYQKR